MSPHLNILCMSSEKPCYTKMPVSLKACMLFNYCKPFIQNSQSAMIYTSVCQQEFNISIVYAKVTKHNRQCLQQSVRCGTGPLSQRSAIAKFRYRKGPGLGLGLVCRSRLQFKRKRLFVSSPVHPGHLR